MSHFDPVPEANRMLVVMILRLSVNAVVDVSDARSQQARRRWKQKLARTHCVQDLELMLEAMFAVPCKIGRMRA